MTDEMLARTNDRQTTGNAAERMRPGDGCLVTGVSGYLASWIAKDLSERGYRVRGSVRHSNDENRLTTLRQLLPGVELVEADLRAETGWSEAVRGCSWVFHVASPQAVRSEQERTRGAVSGTEWLMRAALGEPSVAKIVLTSSEAAIAYGHPPSKRHFSEDDWTVLNSAAGRNDYMRSKTLAERRAWELAADSALNTRGVPLSVINPGFIAGPSLVPWGRFSLDLLRTIAEGRMPLLPDLDLHVVDVRDCARMHIAVMNDRASDGHRHFSVGATGKMVDMARLIREHYAPLGFSPKTWVMPRLLVAISSLISADFRVISSKAGHANHYETRWPDVYRYAHTDLSEIVCASIDSMLEHGWLEPRRARKLPHPELQSRQQNVTS